jgi:hypothetical protein
MEMFAFNSKQGGARAVPLDCSQVVQSVHFVCGPIFLKKGEINANDI